MRRNFLKSKCFLLSLTLGLSLAACGSEITDNSESSLEGKGDNQESSLLANVENYANSFLMNQPGFSQTRRIKDLLFKTYNRSTNKGYLVYNITDKTEVYGELKDVVVPYGIVLEIDTANSTVQAIGSVLNWELWESGGITKYSLGGNYILFNYPAMGTLTVEETLLPVTATKIQDDRAAILLKVNESKINLGEVLKVKATYVTPKNHSVNLEADLGVSSDIIKGEVSNFDSTVRDQVQNFFAVRELWELEAAWAAIRLVENATDGGQWMLKDGRIFAIDEGGNRVYHKDFTPEMRNNLKNFLSLGKSSLTPYETWKLGLTGFQWAMSCPNTGMSDDQYTMGDRVTFTYEDAKTGQKKIGNGIILRAGPSTMHEILGVEDGEFALFVPANDKYSDSKHKNLQIVSITSTAFIDGRNP